LATDNTDPETEARIAALSMVHKRHSDSAAWLMQFERTLALDVGGRKAAPETKGESIVLTVPSSKGGIASPH
jgi:hypothetical protein